ncbi:GspH/FimT family pseudopilin [Candidatus Pacearchaeota archaeon]|nr:GspH/FimT family pseudopilin [Candidatus Pacearchaeota archaeon]
MHRYKYNDKQCGFTLIELMITLVIGGIVMAIGLPAFSSLVKNNRLATQTNSIVTALHLARNEAVNRGHKIRVLPIVDNSTDWTKGWQILDADDTVLRSYDAIEKATLFSGADNITYEPSGYATTETKLILKPDECTANDKRLIIVKRSGLVISERPGDCQ